MSTPLRDVHRRPPRAPRPSPGLATPLSDVDFVVLDLETTGTAPHCADITEVGAARFRRGERVGMFTTLVKAGRPVPPVVTALTGITDGMLDAAPAIDDVLPPLLDFVTGAVIVGHNVAFDRAFLDAALGRSGCAPLGHTFLDTLALSRALLADDEVPNHQLATLADYLRSEHRPRHRALADALATADVLHALIERAATFGAYDLAGLTGLAA